jgi:hypothetical protein
MPNSSSTERELAAEKRTIPDLVARWASVGYLFRATLSICNLLSCLPNLGDCEPRKVQSRLRVECRSGVHPTRVNE